MYNLSFSLMWKCNKAPIWAWFQSHPFVGSKLGMAGKAYGPGWFYMVSSHFWSGSGSPRGVLASPVRDVASSLAKTPGCFFF